MSWPQILEALDRGGLNLSGIARTPEGSAVVVGNGGGALWAHFVSWLAERPHLLQTEPHPLDRYVAETTAALPAHPSRRWVLATDPTLPIQRLAHQAGLGTHSRLGLLLNPTYGPWVGLRAVCFTPEVLVPTGPLETESPCVSCPAPCRTACPASALASERFDLQACASAHVTSSVCARTCHARDACPVGAAHRYPELAVHYHNDPVSGRAALAASLGVEACSGVPRDWAKVLRS